MRPAEVDAVEETDEVERLVVAVVVVDERCFRRLVVRPRVVIGGGVGRASGEATSRL